jgi:hypothetical protein
VLSAHADEVCAAAIFQWKADGMSRIVLSLCDRTGTMVQPWIDAGYEAITVDLQDAGTICTARHHYVADVTKWHYPLQFGRPAIVFAFPPCTHLAVSGARWFKDKGLAGLIEALAVVEACRDICESSSAAWMLENPVSAHTTPEAFAEDYGWSPRRVRKLARELGACRVIGNRMILTDDDVTTILEASKPCPSKSTSAAQSGTTAALLPAGDYEALRAQRARKSPSDSPPRSKRGTGKVILMDRHRS